MMKRSDDAAPGPLPPMLDSRAMVEGRRAPLLRAEYFETGPGRLPTLVSEMHELLFPVQERPLHVTMVRDGAREDLVLGPGDVALTPAGMAASWSWGEAARVLLVRIDPGTLRDFASQEMRILVTGTANVDRSAIHDPELGRAAVALKDAMAAGGVGSGIVFDALSRILLVTIVRRYARHATAALDAALDPERFRRLTAFVDERLEGRISTRDLAAQVGMSETALARALKSATGGTASELVLRARLARARDLMADPARSLAEIAAACGFADHAHLSRSFKKRFGTPPRVWRARLRGALGA